MPYPMLDYNDPEVLRRIIASYQQPQQQAQDFTNDIVRSLQYPAAQQEYPNVAPLPGITWSDPSGPFFPEDLKNIEPGISRIKPLPAVVTPNPTTEPKQQPNNPSTGEAQKDDPMAGYEEYMRLFKNTLPAEPVKDKKRQQQLAIVAGINALGQGLRQVINLNDRNKYMSPINPQADPTALQALAEYEKLNDEYLQRKDRYDMQKQQSMQEALRYAYMDETQREQYKKQLELQNKSQEFQANENDKEQKARAALYAQQKQDQAERDKTLYGYDQDKMAQAHKYDADLIWQRFAADKKLLDEKIGKDKSDAYSGAMAAMMKDAAGENLPVVDQKTGQSVIIPKDIYFDIAQKIAKNPLDPIAAKMIDKLGPDPEQNKQILNTLIASEWQKYYEPVYDSANNLSGFRMLGGGQGASWLNQTPTTGTQQQDSLEWLK